MLAKLTDIQGIDNLHDALEKAGLNFIPEKHELITLAGINVPDHIAIVRNDTRHVLGVMGKDYTPFGPIASLAVSDALKEGSNLKYSSIVSVDGGRRIAIELKGNFLRWEKDELRETITIADSWDGSTKITAMFGFERLVCKNGLTRKEKGNGNSLAIRHTKHAHERLNEALRIMGKAETFFKDSEEKMRALMQKVVTRQQVDKFLDDLIGEVTQETSTRKKNQREDITHLFEHGKGNHGQTAWDLYNGAVEYYDHEVNRENPEKRLASALFGNGMDQKTKAFDLVTAL